MSNPSRERILGRVGKALEHKSLPFSSERRQIFPPVGDLRERFELECKSNYTETIFTAGPAETKRKLQQVIASLGDGSLFAEDVPHIRQLLEHHGGDVQWSSNGPPLESCMATVTRVEALIAATGSLMVSASCGGRAGSIVAPVHIAIAHESQLLPDIESALEFATDKRLPQTNSFIGVITGCSRTADIEKLLVIGAHGPKRLVVLVEK